MPPPEPPPDESVPEPGQTPPSAWTQLRVWLGVGFQSFGGGVATFALIRKAILEERGWLTETEFIRDNALCQLTPGINLIALTILIGRRIGGWRGVGCGLIGLLLPSVTLTILIAASFVRLQRVGPVQAALRGVVPATIGLGLATGLQMAFALLKESRTEGRGRLLWSVLLLAGSATVAAVWRPPVVLVLLAVGALGSLARGLFPPASPAQKESDP